MKHNAFLEKLLQGALVEWKTLGEVCDFQNGFAFKSNLFKEEGLPIIRITNIDNADVNLINAKYFNPSDYGSLENYQVVQGDVLVAMSGATTGKIGYYNCSKVAYLNQRVGKFIPNKNILNNRFLYHFLLMNSSYLYYLAGGGAQPNLSSNILKEKLQIPIPPLSVQQEIVKILDTLTALTSELTSELTLRQKQYQHYRDKLLSFGDEVEWKTLGEICEKIYSGGTPKTNIPEYWENGSIPWMSSGEVNLETIYQTEKFITQLGLDNSSAKFVPKNSIVIALAGQGKTRGKVARTRIDLTTNQSLASLTFNEEKINHDFVYHFLLTQYENLRQISSGSGTRGGLNLQMISNYKIPVPSLEEQKRIASILDKFHTLTSSLSDGLPKEIELRQKQYEYYREILLRFDK